MKSLYLISLFSVSLFYYSTADADIYIDYDMYGNVEISWDWPDGPCEIFNSSWDNKHFKVKVKKKGAALWGSPVYTDTTTGILYPHTGFVQGKEYKVKIKYFTKNKKCRGIARQKLLGVKTFRYDFDENVINPPPPSDTAVRIKSVSFGKCIYPFMTSAVNFYNWVCWSDPGMAFNIIDTGVFNEVKLQSEATGQCIKPINNSNYEKVTQTGCSSMNTVYVLEPTAVPDQYRLKNKENNMCLYASPDDGGFIRQFGCWNNPDMVFEFEDF